MLITGIHLRYKLQIERQFIRIQLSQIMCYSFSKILSLLILSLFQVYQSVPFRPTVIRAPGFYQTGSRHLILVFVFLLFVCFCCYLLRSRQLKSFDQIIDIFFYCNKHNNIATKEKKIYVRQHWFYDVFSFQRC